MKNCKTKKGIRETIRIVLTSRIIQVAVAVCVVALSLFCIQTSNVWATEVQGIGTVCSDGSLNVRSGPGKDYESLGKVESGTMVDIVGMDESQEWYKISYKGETGYVSATYIDFEPAEEIIEEEEENPTADGISLEEEEIEESPSNYKMIFGLLGAIVVLFIIILVTIKSIKKMDAEDDDEDDDSDEDSEYEEYEYDDEEEEEEEEYEEEDEEDDDGYEDDEYDDEDDDDAYEYQTITIRRPKQSTLERQKKNDDYLIDIDPSYFE